MIIENFNKASKIVQSLKLVKTAIDNIKLSAADVKDDTYHTHICQYDDGSGWKVALNGTLTPKECLDAITVLLVNKQEELESQLREL